MPNLSTSREAELSAFDPATAARAARIFDALARYHRLEVRGLERIPSGPSILVANHNGGVYPGDGLFLVEYYRTFGFHQPVYVLTHDILFRLRPLGSVLRKIGMIRADTGSARDVLARGHRLLVFPGGDLETLRPFRRRRQIDLGSRSGFARLALEARVPIVPVASAGSHETMIVLSQGRRLARLLRLRRFARVQSFPLALCLPWGLVFGPGLALPYVPLPSKITVAVGAPIDPFAGDGAAPASASAEAVERLFHRTETALQDLLTGLYRERRLPVLG